MVLHYRYFLFLFYRLKGMKGLMVLSAFLKRDFFKNFTKNSETSFSVSVKNFLKLWPIKLFRFH